MIGSPFLLLSLLAGTTFGLNDWSVPCFDGECSWDSDAGSMRIWGSPAAIADITNAGGWSILDCDAASLNQDIRLVCNNPDGCGNLWNEIGPVGKLVRLPNSCGAQAFARIGRIWVHEDQSIPDTVARSIVRRDGETPIVRGIALDTNFAETDPAVTGEVNIAIQGSNIPGEVGDAAPLPRRSVHLRQSRGLFDFIEKAFNKFNKFDKEVTKELPPIGIDETFNLIDQSLDCPASGNIPAFQGSVKADVITKANAVISIGLAAEGTIIPPKLSTFGAFAGLNAEFRGTLNLKGSASGIADTGKITFFQAGFPGLDFPGILTLGPTFKLQGQALAKLELGVDMQVDLAYKVADAKLFFPKSESQRSGGGFTSNESPLKLSVSPSASAKGTVEAHLIPVVDLGITALGGIAKATIFLNLDAKAAVNMNVDAKLNGDGSAAASGCVDIGAGISVNAGADASFFGLFDQSTSVALFSKDFEFFKKCFETSSASPPATGITGVGQGALPPFPRRDVATLTKRFDLTCLGVNPTNLFSVADEKVSANLSRRSALRFSRLTI